MASIMKRLKSFLSRFLPPSRKAFQKSSSAILAETHRLETHLEQLEEEHLKAQELYHKDLASISRCLSLLTEENQQLKLQLQLQSEEITALRKGRKTQTRQVMQRFGKERLLQQHDYLSRLKPEEYARELALIYRRRTGKILNLENPRTFNEKIQWLKLYDSTPLKTRLADKYLVRDWVAETIGQEYLIPLLGVWDSFSDINFDALPDQFVLKANHGSGWNMIVTDKSQLDMADAKSKFDQWMGTNFAFSSSLELHYINIPPKIIAETYIEELGQLYDYKFMCFDGTVAFLWVDIGRHAVHERAMFTPDWERMDDLIGIRPPYQGEVPRPDNLGEMLALASKLSRGFAHVRVDFYNVNGKIYFGEMTFTSGTGFSRFSSQQFALRVGDMITLPPKSPIPELKY
ncbi:MAG: glycosyltransferase [Oscillospiraceae bacterium]|nr:glycosyltransferase [Oscillospiraceae bacterium]